ncbi:MAG TPA: hypothetical protein VKM55_22675 [Candidatus Lokiarchaeia archaeon]|nr:hypothetical protein [Candidatus Lokiarchaeia archaeon]
MGLKDAVKKRNIASSFKNVGKLFKRKESQQETNPPEQEDERVEEETQEMEENADEVELESDASAIEPEVEPEVEAEETAASEAVPEATNTVPFLEPKKPVTVTPAGITKTPATAAPTSMVKPAVSSTSPSLVKSSSTPVTTATASTSKAPLFSSTLKSNELQPQKPQKEIAVQEPVKSRSKKGDTSTRGKLKGDKKEQDVKSKRQEEPSIKVVEEKLPAGQAKLGLDSTRLVEIKSKMRTILAVSTRIRIDMLREYLQLNNDVFIQLLVNFASEFNYKIDGDYIVLDTVVVNKFTVK